MTNIQSTTVNLLKNLESGSMALNDLKPTQAIMLASLGFLTVNDDKPQLTKKVSTTLNREARKRLQARANIGVACFLASNMKDGVGFSVKPQGKSKSTSILPHLAEHGINRDQVLTALKILRAEGLVETNANFVNNNCSIRWYRAGTYEPDLGVPQNAEPEEHAVEFLTIA
tara:strand:- start:522 stop:1034 length:513 start_codon:yes stop_codon:yes gene_type:complete